MGLVRWSNLLLTNLERFAPPGLARDEANDLGNSRFTAAARVRRVASQERHSASGP